LNNPLSQEPEQALRLAINNVMHLPSAVTAGHEEVCANGDIERVVSVAGGPLAYNAGAARSCIIDNFLELLIISSPGSPRRSSYDH